MKKRGLERMFKEKVALLRKNWFIVFGFVMIFIALLVFVAGADINFTSNETNFSNLNDLNSSLENISIIIDNNSIRNQTGNESNQSIQINGSNNLENTSNDSVLSGSVIVDESIEESVKENISNPIKESIDFAIEKFVDLNKGGNLLVGILAIVYNSANNSIDTNTTTEPTNTTHLSILANGSNSPYDNLVAYWDFDAGNSTTVFDLTNNNNDGVFVNGSAANISGVFGNASNFINSSGQYINISNSSNFFNIGTTGNFTLSAWFRIANTTAARTLVSKRSNSAGSSGAGWSINQRYSVSGRLTFTDGNAVFTTYDTTNKGHLDNNWHHIVFILKARSVTPVASDVDIYVDGVQDTTVAAGTLSMQTNFSNALPFKIGADLSTGSVSSLFNGSIDEVMFFNSTITAQQVSDIYNNQSRRFYPTGTH